MKAILILCLTAITMAAQEIDERLVLVPWAKAPREVPLFFSATAEVKAQASLDAVTSGQKLVFRVHQGKAEKLTLALSGPGEVTSVTGGGLRDWSVRVGEGGARFLDIRPAMVEAKYPEQIEVLVETKSRVVDGKAGLLLPEPGEATGFFMTVDLGCDAKADLKVLRAEGLSPLQVAAGKRFYGTGASALEVSVGPSGAAPRGLELRQTTLVGRVSPDGGSVAFRLAASAVSEGPDSTVELFGGAAALSGAVAGDGWHVALRRKGDGWVHDLVAERGGEFPLEVTFEVPTRRKGDWLSLAFNLAAGVVVPVFVEGLGTNIEFDPAQAVVPRFADGVWRGFLPASGDAALAWHEAEQAKDGSLFFSSTETTDVRVGSGLLRQLTAIDLRVLQGRLGALTLALDGPGEVLSVAGDPVLGWNVREREGKRVLEVKLSRPIEGGARLVIESQAALGGFPVQARALRLVPDGALRHSGWLRVANEGAVRIEVTGAKGLIQLAPGQFPGGTDEKLRQISVYRFPSAEYDYSVNADQVLPEVGLTEVTVYELAETDRRITADLELDIREAPLREWEIEIPADHAVAAVTGTEVADYVVAAVAKDGKRVLKIVFKQAVADRQLISVRLERNEAARAGAWELPSLGFPGVKSHRGYIGAVAAAGYRLTAAKTAGVAEVPVTFFPKSTPGLQQAFRLREDKWSVGLAVEALGQSVQADVFHLYSLKSGAVYGSVVMNFFVVGAPATEWRISVPEGIGNIDVTGPNVGRDWRRDGNTVIVPLSRPVLGTGTLLLTFEQAMNARGGTLALGDVAPLGVQGERGFVQVVSPLQVNHKATASGALLAIDPTELPTEFRLLSSAPTLGVWQYTARDFQIGMEIEWFDPGETVAQVVDFLKLASHVSRDGQWVTDARFFVKSRGNSALRLAFPKGAVLWEARVDGEPVNARADGGETLVPLPSRNDPNQAVEVALRYGARASDAAHPVLTAPRLRVPVVIGEWTVTGDEGRQLVPRGGTADLARPVLAMSGWEWFGGHRRAAVGLLLSGVAALWLGAGAARSRRIAAMLCGLVFLVICGGLALGSLSSARGMSPVLEFAAPVVAAGGEVTIRLANVPPWIARGGWAVWTGFLLGAAVAARGLLKRDRWWTGCGMALAASAFLSIRGGAPLFLAVAGLVGLVWWIPVCIDAFRGLRRSAPAAAAAVVFLTSLPPQPARAEEPLVKPAEMMTHEWSIRDGRLYGTVELAVRAAAGDRFLLLREPAVLSGFEGAGLRVVKTRQDGHGEYWLVADTAGRFTGKAGFEMPLADPSAGWADPGGTAALRRVTVRWNQGGWEFTCNGAARVGAIDGLAADESGAVMLLGPVDGAAFAARPRQRDAASEETRFFAEVSNLFIPGPGVVNGRHRVTVRPAQGRVASLTATVPAGFTVSDVTGGPVGGWRFDPGKRELRVAVEPAQTEGFSFLIETQRGAGALPVDLSLEPLRVGGSAGEIGFLGLAFGEEVQAEGVAVEGLSRVNPGDFDAKLLPAANDGRPLVVLQHAFRYGSAAAKASLKVTAVAPELRSECWQLVSLGEDRLVVTTDLAVSITRSGVFRLALEVPEGLEIESATGDGLSHWTESRDGGRRTVTLHLTGKTIGTRAFSLTLGGRPTGAQAKWPVPRISLRDASRETGVLTIVPERGLQVRAVERGNVSQLDPRELADEKKESARAAARPGALAYRLLQGDWSLSLAIGRLDPWVTARVFHDATIREGQLLTRVNLAYKIENAAVKTLRVRIPGLDEKAAATLRATGPAVADLVAVEGEKGLWEIRFQRGIAGETGVDLEYQRPSPENGGETVDPVVPEGVRQMNYFAVVRAGGRLELDAGALPRGWQRSDWAVVQAALGQAASGPPPAMAFRVAEPEGPLPVVLKRHNLADLRKLRVSEGSLTTLLSADGSALTAVVVKLQVVGKGTLRLKLPENAELFNVFVNDEGSNLVRERGDWLFHVAPAPEPGKPASLRFVYSSNLRSGRLEGPVLDVPMENLAWRVLVPEGWRLASHGGDFDLRERQLLGSFKLEDYQSFVKSKRREDAKSAVQLLDQANAWLEAGDQEKAGLALGSAVNNGLLDEASGEDARVQLRALKTQQAVLGLNTRRQKLVLDNRSAAPQAANPQLDRAAQVNPVLRGAYNFDPRQFDRFLEGNTADENAALKEIANRIVSQQLAAEPAPAALDITLPERGTVLTFGRSVQVDGGRPMALEIDLKRSNPSFAWTAAGLCLALGAMTAMKRRK